MMKKNVIIKQECHSRMPLSGIYNACRYHNKEKDLLNRYVEDPRLQTSGMTPLWMSGQGLTYREEALNKNSFRAPLRSGFTLIELLVVVLIIGILAAVAVPQYQKAVAKSRFIQLQTAGDAFIKSYKLYRLANGEDPTTFEQLDILSLPNISEEDKTRATSGNIQCKISTSAELTCWQRDPTLAKNSPDFVYFFPTSTAGHGKAGKRICRGFNELHKEVCLSVGGTYVNDGGTYTDYILP